MTNPMTMRLLEAAAGAGLGAAGGAGLGYAAGDEHHRPIVSGALLGGLAGAGGASVASLVRRAGLIKNLRDLAAKQTAVLEQEASELARHFDYGLYRMHADEVRGGGLSADDANAAMEMIGRHTERRWNLLEQLAESIPKQRLQEGTQRVEGSLFGGFKKTSGDKQRGKGISMEDLLSILRGRLIMDDPGPQLPTHKPRDSRQYKLGAYSPLAPRDVNSRDPLGPLWGAIGAGTTLALGTHGGKRGGEELAKVLATQLRGQAARLPSSSPEAAKLLQQATSLKKTLPRYGMYGGAALGIPLGLEVGKRVAQSPRWGIMEYMA